MWTKQILRLSVLSPAYWKSQPKVSLLMMRPQVMVLTGLDLLEIHILLAHFAL